MRFIFFFPFNMVTSFTLARNDYCSVSPHGIVIIHALATTKIKDKLCQNFFFPWKASHNICSGAEVLSFPRSVSLLFSSVKHVSCSHLNCFKKHLTNSHKQRGFLITHLSIASTGWFAFSWEFQTSKSFLLLLTNKIPEYWYQLLIDIKFWSFP